MADIERAFIPRVLATEHDADRFRHRDIARGDYDATQAWAEAHVLTDWLATEIFQRRRPRTLAHDADHWVTDHDWARERIQRLRAVSGKRRAA